MSQTVQYSPLDKVRSEARRSMEAWFARLGQAEEKREPVANVFVMGNCLELLQVFDVHMVFPEILALQTAVRKVSLDYIHAAEGWGMSTDACNYVKADVGMALKGMQHPGGKIPKPSLAIGSNICLVFTKWAEIWERLHKCPAFILDIPLGRAHSRPYVPGSSQYEADKEYVLAQLWELVELLGKITGKRFDPTKLAEAEAHTNRAMNAWRGILEINQNTPALYDALADGVVLLGMINIARGTKEGADFFEMALEEFKRGAEQHYGVLPHEKFRLLFHGVACYPAMRRFQAMFHGWNSVFVTSPYLTFACGGFVGDFLFDTSKPMESLAELTLRCNHLAHQAMYFTDEFLFNRALMEKFHIDGIVFHAVKSCRTVSTSHANTREFLSRHHRLPCLYLESDHVDPRYFSEAQIKNRVDAFFEALTQKKFHGRE
ncbi:2-hydroxyacyl-CoA dehydratase [Candidatus Acetothermia bacterium]|nr:2-hydroxyacyl-CoA dehydratase [Candidatus Acetothermia bacterium]